MSLVYNTAKPEKTNFVRLFESTGWNESYKLTPEELNTAVQNSWYCVSVYDCDNLIGFGRVICDGIEHALILDVIVLPEYQGKGIGREIMQRILSYCREHRIRDIQLFTSKGKQEFYEKLGFGYRPDDAPGMEIRLKY